MLSTEETKKKFLSYANDIDNIDKLKKPDLIINFAALLKTKQYKTSSQRKNNLVLATTNTITSF